MLLTFCNFCLYFHSSFLEKKTLNNFVVLRWINCVWTAFRCCSSSYLSVTQYLSLLITLSHYLSHFKWISSNNIEFFQIRRFWTFSYLFEVMPDNIFDITKTDSWKYKSIIFYFPLNRKIGKRRWNKMCWLRLGIKINYLFANHLITVIWQAA